MVVICVFLYLTIAEIFLSFNCYLYMYMWIVLIITAGMLVHGLKDSLRTSSKSLVLALSVESLVLALRVKFLKSVTGLDHKTLHYHTEYEGSPNRLYRRGSFVQIEVFYKQITNVPAVVCWDKNWLPFCSILRTWLPDPPIYGGTYFLSTICAAVYIAHGAHLPPISTGTGHGISAKVVGVGVEWYRDCMKEVQSSWARDD